MTVYVIIAILLALACFGTGYQYGKKRAFQYVIKKFRLSPRVDD